MKNTKKNQNIIDKYGIEEIEKVKMLILENNTSNKIQKITGFSIKSISAIRKFYGITKKQKRKTDAKTIELEPKIIKFIQDGYTTSYIIEKTNASRSLICSIAKKNNLKTNKADINQEINLTYEEEQVLIGGLLGDSYITISKKSKYPHGCIGHCIEQYDYAVYKQNYLKRLTSPVSLFNKYDKRSNRHYQQAWVVIKSQKALLPYYYSFYGKG